MATFIHGIAASENIDSSGERISIAGMDISSLAVDGTMTYEHEAATGPKGEKITIKMPEQTVGKVLKAKKIFSEKDCEDEHELYFWNKCKTPYIYAMGELFDDYTDAARDLAGKLRYDADRKNQNERTIINFSIEGAYIAKEGIEVTRSVARKITLTSLPCNKAAVAELVPNKTNKNDIDALFKTETIEIELFKTEPKAFHMPAPMDDMKKHADILGLEPMQKSTPPLKPAGSAPATPKLPGATSNTGTSIGATKSGKNVMSHAKIHEYHGFSGQDHQDAAHLHHSAAQAATAPKMGAHHLDKMKLHLQAAKSAETKGSRFARGKAMGSALGNGLNKTLEAGSGMAAPGNLVGGAALGKESLHKSEGSPKFEEHPKHKIPEKVKAVANAHHKKNPGAIHSVETESDGNHWLHLSGHTVDNDGQHSYRSDGPSGVMSDIKAIRPCHCAECKQSLGKSEDHQLKAKLVQEPIEIPSEGPGSYGNVKPHVSHKEMKDMGKDLKTIDFHERQSNLHKQHSKTAKAKGDHELAEKHNKMAEMHGRYDTANLFGPHSHGHFSDRRSALKEHTDKAKNLHRELSKSELLARAEDAYQGWDKKEEFQAFMQLRMPHLVKSEIDAIGQTLALKKSIDAEQKLSKLINK